MMKTLARRLTPLLVAFVAACNINDASSEPDGSRATPGNGVFAPRVVAAGGRLAQSDSVLLTLLTRKDSLARWDTLKTFRKLWEEGGVHIDTLKIGSLWKAHIAGVTKAGDTLWKGSDSGSIVAATRRDYQDSGSVLRVRNLAAKPSLVSLPAAVVAGSLLDLTSLPGKVVHGWGANVPSCDGGDSAKSFAVAGTILNLRACGDSLTWPSQVVSRTFTVAASHLGLSDSLLKAGGASVPRKSWDSTVALKVQPGETVSWSLAMGSATESGTGDSIRIPKAWIAALPAIGTEFPVTAKVTVLDAKGALVQVDSLRWTLTVPETRMPTIAHSYSSSYDSVALDWLVVDSTTMVLRTPSFGGAPEEFAPSKGRKSVAIGRGDSVRVGVVAYGPATGRRSDTAWSAFQAPGLKRVSLGGAVRYDSVLHFSSVGETGDMYVTVVHAVLAQAAKGTDSAALIGASSYRDSADGQGGLSLLPKSATRFPALGLVRLYKGKTVIDSQWISWTVQLPVVAAPSVRLDSLLRSDSVLVFRWVSSDSVRVTWSVDSGRTSHVLALAKDDSLKVAGLQPNQRCSLSVALLDGTTRRESLPAPFVGSTRNRPRAPTFTATNSDWLYGLVTVSLTGWDKTLDSGTVWQAGFPGAIAGSVSYSDLDTSRSRVIAFNVAETYPISLRAIRDGDTATAASVNVKVLRTAGVAPKMPLVGLTRGLDSLAWDWKAASGRLYRAYWMANGSALSDTAKADSARTVNGHFALRNLAQARTVAVLFGVQATEGDSLGGMSFLPVSGTTKLRPVAKDIVSSLKGVRSGGAIAWSWVSSLPSLVKGTGLGETLLYAANSSYSYSASLATGYDYRISVKVKNADSVVSLDSVLATLHLPQPQPALDTAYPHFFSRLADTVWRIADSADWTGKAVPDSLRAWISGGVSRSFAYAEVHNGVSLPLNLSSASQALTLQWLWANGDTSSRVTMNRAMVFPAFVGSAFVASGAGADTLYDAQFGMMVSGSWGVGGWSCHVKGGTWKSCGSSTPTLTVSGTNGNVNLAGMSLASGTDSILVNFASLGGDASTAQRKVAVTRTKDTSVTYRDNTTGTIRIARLNGVTWMAQNLNWSDTRSVSICKDNSADTAICRKYGRYFTASQAWYLASGNRYLSKCDTAASGSDAECILEASRQGACPVGWHLPSAADWNGLSAYGSGLLSEDWAIAAYSNIYGLDLKWSGNALLGDAGWEFEVLSTALSRQSWWSSTQNTDNDQTFAGGYEEFGRAVYANSSTYFYNPTVPRRKIAYPIRCIRN